MILVGQRRAGDRFQFKWEFPGGKVEPDEDPKEALARELTEELGIVAEIGEELARYEHYYPGKTAILLMFYRVVSFTGEPKNHVFESIRWETRHKLPEYDFLDGDVDFVRRLAKGLFRSAAGT
ncbi:MAG: (deoxy)nucleoside triphosphate pyrophosphohydrolase [Acidobacteria bacterium]|nr:(deoxy)nucleoside triphosphate pyrophosphohydrolase [Acidobacteriota bacterium]